jgi:polysaccharide deacetylase family protein (PEP-CTERM system associated)
MSKPFEDISDAGRSLISDAPVNAMTIDVEEYFQVSAFEGRVSRESWLDQSSRVGHSMDRIFDALDQNGVKATFFTLGWVAERNPALIRRIVDEGHELASHGFFHGRVTEMTPRGFLEDVGRTKKTLEDISGVRVIGYRAPSFSIDESNWWAYGVLAEAGYRYSSSIYPITHDHYGVPSAPRFPFRLPREGMVEIPLTTARFAGRNWPAAGGGYFRLFPSTYSWWALRRVNTKEAMPAAFYFHPWELDPDQPRFSGLPLKTRLRHYLNLSRFEGRLRSLLGGFRWGRMDHVYSTVIHES